MTSSTTQRDIYAVEDFRKIPNFRAPDSRVIQSQYSHSPHILALAAELQRDLDASGDLDRYFRDVYDPNTATGVFLDWWGKRVGVSRYITIDGEKARLDDDTFRFLLFYRALCNVRGTSAADINELLGILVDCDVWLVDYQDMTVNLVLVTDSLTEGQIAILRNYGLLNRPGGVLLNLILVYGDLKILGFDGQELESFGNGVFNNGTEYTLESE